MDWEMKYYPKNFLTQMQKEFKKESIITRLLLNKNIFNYEDAQNYLNLSYIQLHDPFLFENMEVVVDKLLKYRNTNKKILIFADHDIDGISGGIYLSKIFDNIGILNDIYIPPRNIFKYSLDDDFFKNAKNYSLIISVDNSFGNENEILKLKNMGIELIITDHHFNNKVISDILEINPKKSLTYPFKELSGSGVVFKLAQAIYYKTKGEISKIYEYIELISIATIADVMESSDENRFIIKRGFKNISRTKIKALEIIIENLKIIPEYISITDISYRISPLLNAISKFDDPYKIVTLFKSNDEIIIKDILNQMYLCNNIRKNLETEISKKIIDDVKNKNIKNLKYIYYEIEDVNLGLLGSITSKISLEFKVPVILLTKFGDYYKGSCRSLNNKNIYDILDEFSNYFENYGGHSLAAGFLIKKENLFKIRKKLKSRLNKLNFTTKENRLKVDAIFNFNDLNYKILKEISKFKPYGLGNSEPNFYTENLSIYNVDFFGKNDNHFKANIFKNGLKFEIIGYNLAYKIIELKKEMTLFKVIYTPELINKNTIKIKVKDMK